MPFDAFMFDDDDLDEWSDDPGNCGLPPPRRRSSDIESPWRDRTLDETIALEVILINQCSDLTPEYWIKIYAKRFRDVMDFDSSLPAWRVKRILYANEPFWLDIK
jgi:hypothetical protein